MLSILRIALRGAALLCTAAILSGLFAQPSEARYRAKSETKTASHAPAAPAVSPDDPLTLVVSLGRQRIEVYRGGTVISSSRISSGSRTHPTPSGIFSIVQKQRWHRSNMYSGAPMPFMQRITWSGVALHAGYLPGYAASHGCIRLPSSFATRLYKLTDLGEHVLVVPDKASFHPIDNPVLFQPAPPARVATAEAMPVIKVSDTPGVPRDQVSQAPVMMANAEAGLARLKTATSDSPLRMLVTRRTGRERIMDVQRLLKQVGFRAGDVDGWMGPDTSKAILAFEISQEMLPTGQLSDEVIERLFKAAGKGAVTNGHLYVRQDFKPVLDMPIHLVDPDAPLGTHFFVAMHFAEGDAHTKWLSMNFGQDGPTASEALSRIQIPEELRERISMMLTPGSSLIVSDDGISGETAPAPKGGTDFIVLMK